jgi:hypothetical protein
VDEQTPAVRGGVDRVEWDEAYRIASKIAAERDEDVVVIPEADDS